MFVHAVGSAQEKQVFPSFSLGNQNANESATIRILLPSPDKEEEETEKGFELRPKQ